MGIALDIFRKLQYAEGYEKGYEIGMKIGLEQARGEKREAELANLRKRVAELERINGISPDESHPSDEYESQE